MVRVQVKHGGGGGHNDDEDEKEFLYDCLSTLTIDEIAKDIIQLSNLQLKIQRLVVDLQPRLSLLHGDPKVLSLMRALSEANSYSSKDQVLHNRPLSYYVLRDHMQTIEREFMVNRNAIGLQDSNLQQILTDLNLLQDDAAVLLWAGKELVRSKQLCDYIGKNEKTKITLRLQSPVSRPSCQLSGDG